MRSKPTEVSDLRSNAPEQIEYAVQTIGRSEIRRKLFEAVYHYTSAKSATALAARTELARTRVIKEISRLLKNSLAARFQDGVVAVVEGELDFDAAVVFEFG
jgi:hypothetical protein